MKADPFDDVKERYIAHIMGRGPAPTKPQPIDTAELLRLQGHTAALAARSPGPGLEVATREQLGGKRSALLPELLHQCARGLAQQEALAAAIGVSASLCESVAAQDGTIGQVIKAAGDLFSSATTAADLGAAEADELGTRVLKAAQAIAADSRLDRQERAPIELSFAEAFRLFEEVEARAARGEKRSERRLRPLVAARDKARSEAQELQLIEKFLARSE